MLCYDFTVAMASPGGRRFSAPLSMGPVLHMRSTVVDRNATLCETVYICTHPHCVVCACVNIHVYYISHNLPISMFSLVGFGLFGVMQPLCCVTAEPFLLLKKPHYHVHPLSVPFPQLLEATTALSASVFLPLLDIQYK